MERQRESLDKNYSKWFLTRVKRDIKKYHLIEEGDRVCLGVSGGEDSSALLYILSIIRHHSDFHLPLHAVFVDMGWEMDISPLQELCWRLEIPLHVEKTVIARIVFERRKEKNPCSLCAKLRRGALHKAAQQLDCNKVALGHHLDDAAETFFLNWLHSGRLDTFRPHTYLSRRELYLVRPMIGLTKKTLSSLARRENLPELKNPCPVAGQTERETMQEIVSFIISRHPNFYKRFVTSMNKIGLWSPVPHKTGAGQ